MNCAMISFEIYKPIYLFDKGFLPRLNKLDLRPLYNYKHVLNYIYQWRKNSFLLEKLVIGRHQNRQADVKNVFLDLLTFSFSRICRWRLVECLLLGKLRRSFFSPIVFSNNEQRYSLIANSITVSKTNRTTVSEISSIIEIFCLLFKLSPFYKALTGTCIHSRTSTNLQKMFL